MEAALFYSFAAFAVLGALGVITFKKPTRALLSLMVTMFSLAVLFLTLQAHFVAMAYLIVYAGAVLVLFLFVIMLLGLAAKELPAGESFKKIYLAVAFFVPIAFLGILLWIASSLGEIPLNPTEGSPENFGTLLFTRYLLPFELVSFLLLIGVFAAVALASSQPVEKPHAS